jgi:hypothetical protein
MRMLLMSPRALFRSRMSGSHFTLQSTGTGTGCQLVARYRKRWPDRLPWEALSGRTRKRGFEKTRDRSTEGECRAFYLLLKQHVDSCKLFLLFDLSRSYALKMEHDFGGIQECACGRRKIGKKATVNQLRNGPGRVWPAARLAHHGVDLSRAHPEVIFLMQALCANGGNNLQNREPILQINFAWPVVVGAAQEVRVLDFGRSG